MYTTVSYDNLDTYLAGLAANTQDTPYEIEISNVTVSFLHGYSVSRQGTLQYVLQNNATKYVSLKFEAPAELTSIDYMCYGCTSLVGIVVTGMENVTVAGHAFFGCTSLASLNLPTMADVTDASFMFRGCTSLTSVDVSGMTSVTNASSMFYECISLTSVDVSGMTNVTDASFMFTHCTSLTSVDVSGMTRVTDAQRMFLGCTRLTEIHGWSVPSTAEMTDCFSGCTALEAIYVPEPSPAESSWRAWDIRKDTANNQSTVTVYKPDGTSNSVSVPSAGTYTMKVTDKVDELLFSPSEEIPAATIQKMLQTKAPITAKDALDPTKDNFMLLAKDRSSARTNVTTDVIEAGNKLPPTSEAVRAAIGSVVPVDIVEHGNMSAVTSNAVSISLSYSTEETLTGGTWIDGKPIYKRTFEVYKNGILNGWTRNGVNFTCSAGLSYIDQLIKNEAITDRCILTSYGFGTDNVQYPVGIRRSGTNAFEIRNGDRNNFFGTKCILTIEYTRKTE